MKFVLFYSINTQCQFKIGRYVLFNFCLGNIRNENKQNNRDVENNFDIDTYISEQLENLNEDDQLIYTSNKYDIVEFVASEAVQETGSLDSGLMAYILCLNFGLKYVYQLLDF